MRQQRKPRTLHPFGFAFFLSGLLSSTTRIGSLAANRQFSSAPPDGRNSYKLHSCLSIQVRDHLCAFKIHADLLTAPTFVSGSNLKRTFW